MMNKSQEFEDLLTETKAEAIQQSAGRLDKPRNQKIPGIEVVTIVDTTKGSLKFLEESIRTSRVDGAVSTSTIRYFLLQKTLLNPWKRWIRKGDRGFSESGQLYVVTDLIDTHPFWEKIVSSADPEYELKLLNLFETETAKKDFKINNPKPKPVEPDYSKIPDIFK